MLTKGKTGAIAVLVLMVFVFGFVAVKHALNDLPQQTVAGKSFMDAVQSNDARPAEERK